MQVAGRKGTQPHNLKTGLQVQIIMWVCMRAIYAPASTPASKRKRHVEHAMRSTHSVGKLQGGRKLACRACAIWPASYSARVRTSMMRGTVGSSLKDC